MTWKNEKIRQIEKDGVQNPGKEDPRKASTKL